MPRRRSVIWLVSLGAPLLAVVLVAFIWGWDLLIPVIAAQASAYLGRPVHIAHLHITPGRVVQVTADDVTIGNPTDWQGFPLASIRHLVVRIDAWAYIRHGQMVVPLVALEQPQVAATQLQNGSANYKLQLASRTGPGARIGEVRIDGGYVRLRLAKLKADVGIDLRTEGEGEQEKLVAEAHGTYNAQPISGRLVGGAVIALEDRSRPWPIDLRLQNGPTEVSLIGSITDPTALQGTDLKLRLAGPDMALLGPLTGLPMAKTPSYLIAGQLELSRQHVRLRDFAARVGSSDLRGTIDVNPDTDPPDMVAELTSRRVDLADLGGFIGAEPGRTTTPGQTAAQRAEIARAEAQPKLIPDTPISIPKLHWANVHVKYHAGSIAGRSVPLDNLSVVADIVNGQVNIHPLSFGVGAGRITGSIQLTPQGNLVHTNAKVEFQRLDVSRLMAATHMFQGAGAMSGGATLEAVGNSLAQMVDNGHGELQLAMVGGDLSAVLVDLSGLEFTNALLSALGMPKRTAVECFITDAGLDRGILRLRTMVLDTGEGVLTATGGADLRNEQLDLALRTESKHFTIGSLPTPLHITGTLKHPGVTPGVELGVRGGLAIGLGVAFPPLALLPTIQFGVGEDHRCDKVLALARRGAAKGAR
jgi:hypothetical protein